MRFINMPGALYAVVWGNYYRRWTVQVGTNDTVFDIVFVTLAPVETVWGWNVRETMRYGYARWGKRR